MKKLLFMALFLGLTFQANSMDPEDHEDVDSVTYPGSVSGDSVLKHAARGSILGAGIGGGSMAAFSIPAVLAIKFLVKKGKLPAGDAEPIWQQMALVAAPMYTTAAGFVIGGVVGTAKGFYANSQRTSQ